MIAQENKYTNLASVYPTALMIDASGVGTTDGSEFTALPQNDGWEAFQQALMDYVGSGGTNAPTGTPGVPNGVSDAAGISQMVEAMHLAFGIGPGTLKIWMKDDDPAVTGDRVLLLQEQGVLIATYPDLDAATWVGDTAGNNATVHAGGGKFYRSSDSGGATPNPAGPYLQLPESRGYAMRVLDALAAVDPQGASRFLGDNQLDAFQAFQVGSLQDNTGARNYFGLTEDRDVSVTGSGTANATIPQFRTTAQGSVKMIQPVDDGTNGTPRTDSETRMSNLSIKLGITY